MEFEEQIKLLAKEIYEKVVRFIYDNKDNDDKFYEYVYLKLNDGVQVMFSFSNSRLYITKEDEQGFSATFGYEIKIINDETEYNHNGVIYQTSLSEKIARSQKAGQRHALEMALNRQQNLTEKEKEDIRKYYEQINKAIDSMSYNTEKTHTIDNFNDDMFDVYNEYMYEKELNKMENIPNRILPAVQVAVDWWTEILCGKTRGGSIGNDADSRVMMIFSNILYPNESISSDQIIKFKEILTKKIMAAIYEYDGEVIQMKCDYGPDYILYEAMKESGISPNRTPYKTDMYIRAYYVAVKEGYGAKDVILFDSTEEKDIEIVKNKYYEAYQVELQKQEEKGFSKVLKKEQ